MKTTEELAQAVEAYQKGDKEAFTALYEQSYRYLYTCIMYIVRSEDTTQDMLQETYLEIVKKIETLRSTEDFLNWAAVIATHKCFAYLKKNRDLLAEDAEGTFDEIPDDEGMIPEEVMQDKEKQRLFREIIDSLSDMQRLCVIGYYYNEQSQESLAQELGIPVGTVKSHLNRARARIKLAVEELDVKKDTRLYNVAPLVLVLMEEEIKSCIVQPMSAALAAGAGAGKVTAEGFSIVRKLKALWAKLSAGAKAKAAAGAVVACTAGAMAAVAFNQPEIAMTHIISDDAKELFNQITKICGEGNYEELYMLDLSAIDAVQEEDEGFDNVFCYDENGQKVEGYFYDGQSNELKADYTGYGIGIEGWEFAIGQFNHGKAEGRLVTVRITYWDEDAVDLDAGVDDEDDFIDFQNPDITISEMNVENGMIAGEVTNSGYRMSNDLNQPKAYLYEQITGKPAYICIKSRENERRSYDICLTDKIAYDRYSAPDLFTGEQVEEHNAFYLKNGILDTERNRYVDGQWLDIEGNPCDYMEQFSKGFGENIRVHARWDHFDVDESDLEVMYLEDILE